MENKTPSTPIKKTPHKLGVKTIEGYVIGRSKTVVPPDEVFKLAEIGCKDHEIAAWFAIDENTLRFNFSAELIKGRETLKISLRRAMLKNAIVNENTTMQIWLSKNYLGMSDNPSAADGQAPLPWIEGTDDGIMTVPDHSEEEYEASDDEGEDQ